MAGGGGDVSGINRKRKPAQNRRPPFFSLKAETGFMGIKPWEYPFT